jgi:hypothetical protein
VVRKQGLGLRSRSRNRAGRFMEFLRAPGFYTTRDVT